MAKNVCDMLLEILASAGVERIYGIPGDAINELVDSIRRRDDISFVQVRHEEVGAFAAGAEAKLTGNLGVCVGTAGPGALHLLNGLYDAKMDAAPVLALTGQVETRFLGASYHQEIDQSALFHDVAVYSQTVTNPEQIPRLATLACQAALSQRGVAHLALPQDVAGRTTSGAGSTRVIVPGCASVPAEEELERAVALLGRSARPTILAGAGCRDAREELIALATRLGAPIVKTLRAKDVIPDDHELVVGGLGLLGTRPGLQAIEGCDVLVMAGTDFPYPDFYPEGVPAIQIDVDPARLGRRYPVEVGLAGHARPTLAALAERVPFQPLRAHLEEMQGEVEKWRTACADEEAPAAPPLRPQAVAARVSETAADDAIFVCDTGAVTVWGARHVRIRGSQRFTLSSSLGSMGFALCGALGAQLAHPDRQVVALAGDGGLGMFLGDFLTAVKYELPITVVVFNNRKLGLIQMEQEVAGKPEFETGLEDLDFGRFAELCGGAGARVRDADQLDDALRAALPSATPWIVDVEVNPDELTLPPRIEAGQALGFGLAKMREILGQGDRDGALEDLADRLKRPFR